MKNKITNYICFFINSITVMILIFILLITFIIDIGIGVGNSMSPTMENGVFVFGFKNHFYDKYERFEIVHLKFDENLALKYTGDKNKGGSMKRIIGLPGEHVQVIGYDVYINGVKIEQPFLKEDKNLSVDYEYLDVRLSDNEYYVMGDNRSVSFDSRSAGGILKEDIIAKIVYFN